MQTKGPLLAEGNTAEVFAWGDSYVLKLYRSNYGSDEAEREAALVRAVIGAGVHTPAVIETVAVEGRAGVVFERVEGLTMMEAMLVDPAKVDSCARLLAELQFDLHKLSSADVPTVKDRLHSRLQRPRNRGVLPQLMAKIGCAPNESNLSEPAVEQVLAMLEKLPDGNALCHGDFNPSNVLLTEAGPTIIDWVDAACGDPAADVARTTLLFRHAILPPQLGAEVIRRIDEVRHTFVEAYLAQYSRLSNVAANEIELWSVPVAAGRVIDEHIPPEEKHSLTKIVMTGLRCR